MELYNTGLSNKFSGLLYFLRRSRNEFEMVADEIGDNSLRTALNGLSAESNFYAGELKDYLGSLGISPLSESLHEEDIYNNAYPANESDDAGDELQNICSYNEHTLVKAYNELLDEAMPFQSLKDIMRYQLNALKYTFLKIKTLNSARFAAC